MAVSTVYSHEGKITLENKEILHYSDPEGTGFVIDGKYTEGRIHLISKPQNGKNRTSHRRMLTVWCDKSGVRRFETMLKYKIREEELKLLVEIDPFFVSELIANQHLPFLSFLVREESALG